jgi:hypothetical protein
MFLHLVSLLLKLLDKQHIFLHLVLPLPELHLLMLWVLVCKIITPEENILEVDQ